jgi:hypothetical protein
MSDDAKPLDPEQMQQLARIRRFMMIASVTTFVAIAIVFAVIGYKVYKSGDNAQALAPTLPLAAAGLPPGAKVLSTTVGDRRVVLTVETQGGAVELHSFDLETLRPVARFRLESKP